MSAFSANMRVLLCNQCLAPVQAPLAGGQVPCQRCGTVNPIQPRDDRTPLAPPGRPAVPEAERINRLRAQDGKPWLPPPSIQALFEGPGIPDWKVQEAMAVWNQARFELRQTASFDAGERLVFLTSILGSRFGRANEPWVQRGLLESALDAVTLPRQRQMMRGGLARAAGRDGDWTSAETWLAPCDPQSDDLESDSEWRVTRAYLDSGRRDWNAVISVLGRTPDEVPIRDSMDTLAAVLRANAWEQAGQLPTATQLLMMEMAKGPHSRETMRRIVEYHAPLRLCTGSFAAADAQYSQEAAKVAGSSVGGGVGGFLFYLGALFLLASAGLGIWAAVDRSTTSMSALTVLTGLVPAGLIMFFLGRGLRNAGKRAERLRLHGLRGQGAILGVARTGTEINNVPMMRIRLRVQLEGMPPYEAETKMLIPPQVMAQLTPGATVSVRVDPQNPADVMIEGA
ncbi:MAG: hypothetical protein JXB32_10805 [Deltaproteobacteria bacterium]|nr:hypothetical protein [Deltaproteobacteria bacterium]